MYKAAEKIELIVGSRVEGVGFGSCGLGGGGVTIVHVIVIVAIVRVKGSKLHGIFFTGWLVIRSGNGFCQSTSRPVCAGKLFFSASCNGYQPSPKFRPHRKAQRQWTPRDPPVNQAACQLHC